MRKNGFDTPYSRDQQSSTICHILLMIYFCSMSVLTFSTSAAVPIVLIYCLAQFVFISLWLNLEVLDPATDGGFVLNMKENQDVKRYCPSCRKMIAGFDHHCSWLNTCIGKKNYFQFYLMSFAGSVVFSYQTTVGLIFIMVRLSSDSSAFISGTHLAVTILWGVLTAISFVISSLFISLFVFNTYLVVIRKGTYDWIIEGQKRRAEIRKQRRSVTGLLVAEKQIFAETLKKSPCLGRLSDRDNDSTNTSESNLSSV